MTQEIRNLFNRAFPCAGNLAFGASPALTVQWNAAHRGHKHPFEQSALAGWTRAVWLAAACLVAAISIPAFATTPSRVTFEGVQTILPASGLTFPIGVAVDQAGDVFIGDQGNNRVVKLTPAGVQSTVGSGLNTPYGVAVDAAGNVFITDTGNNRVVKVTPAGVQTTVVTGLNHPDGITVDGAGNLYIADFGSGHVYKVTPGGIQTAVGTGLRGPYSTALDAAGDVYIADAGNNRVVKVTPGGVQTVVINTGLNFPDGVAVDGTGDVFVADNGNNRVFEIPAGCSSSSCQITLGGRNVANPTGVVLNASGDVFIVSNGGSQILEVQRNPAVDFGGVNVCPGTQTAPAPCSQTFRLLYSVATTTTIVATNIVTQGNPNLDFTLNGTNCPGVETAPVSCAVLVTFTPRAPGVRLGAVQVFDSSNNLLATTYVSGTGQGPAIAFGPGAQSSVASSGLVSPTGVVVDATGDVYFSDTGNNRVLKVAPGGVQTTVPAVGLETPTGLAVDGVGNLYIANSNTNANTVVVISPSGAETTVPAQGLSNPKGLAVDGGGDVFIVDANNSRVVKVTPVGSQTTIATNLSNPIGVAVDGAGNVFIPDPGNNRVLEVPVGGGPQVTVGSGLNSPYGVAVDGAGDVFIADLGNNRVVEVPASGGPQFTVGSGLITPVGVAVDSTGNVFIGDTGNNRVVEVNRSQAPSLSFAATNVGSASSDSPQLVIAQNIGNEPLIAVAPGLSVAANFVQVTGLGPLADCSSSFTLTPGAGCNLSLGFVPQSSGSITGTATLTDNALNNTPSATQSLSLQGTGNLRPQTIAFTTSAPASAVYQQSFTVVATGGGSGNALTFTSAGACSNVGSTYTLTASTGSCTVTVNQAGNSNYQPAATVVETVSARQDTPSIQWTTPAAITYGTGLSSAQLNAVAIGANGAQVAGTFSYGSTPVPTLKYGTILPVGQGIQLVVVFQPTDSTNFLPTYGFVFLTVNKATTSTTIAVTTTQTVTGTTATITPTVKPQIGGTPTGTVIYYDGSAVLGSATVGTAFTTSVLPVGTNQITAVYGGDSNFVGSSSSATTVTSVAPTNVTLTPLLNHVFYPASAVAFTVTVPLKNLQLISGTITLYDGSTVIGTYPLPAGGILVGITPLLSVGTHNLRAVYSGNTKYTPGQSPIQTVTVSAL